MAPQDTRAAADADSVSAEPPAGAQRELLCVDLDGTLVATDTLHECLLVLLREAPGSLLRLPFWLAGGKARCKDRVARAAVDRLPPLPYREPVLRFIEERRAAGAEVVLATAANERIARRVADDLGCFDHVLASDARTNLSGATKLAAIRAYAAGRPFGYAGDHRRDLPVWRAAAQPIVVNRTDALLSACGGSSRGLHIPTGAAAGVATWLRQVRWHQWSKNALLLVPLVLAHQLGSLPAVAAGLLAVLVFSLAASAVYLFNDLFDLPHDRQHPEKGKRPLSAGRITIVQATGAAVLLVAGSLALSALFLPAAFTGLLLGYLILNGLYTGWLKRVVVVDVVLLATFYVYRIVIGSVAVGVELSAWLLAFSLFFFLGLGMVKRLSDLQLLESADAGPTGRGYRPEDREFFRSFGPACSCVAVLVMALYIHAEEVVKHYAHPEYLWFACPLILYWIGRIWFLANRGEIQSDPVVFALQDRTSYVVGALTAIFLLLATFP